MIVHNLLFINVNYPFIVKMYEELPDVKIISKITLYE